MNNEKLIRVAYLAPNGQYVRSGGTSTTDISQADIYFKGSRRFKDRWERYGYKEIPVTITEITT